MDKDKLIDLITAQVMNELGVVAQGTQTADNQPVPGGSTQGLRIPVGISNRHLHVSREDLDILYGTGYELNIKNPLKQPGEFAAKETVTLVGPRHAIENVRILGPIRPKTQVEICQTDAITLGIPAPVRLSGKTEGSSGITIVGPKGTVILKEGVMRANRHIHILEKDAATYGLTNGQIVAVKTINTEKPTMFFDVMVRVLKNGFLELHIDTDDGNAAGLKNDDLVEIVL